MKARFLKGINVFLELIILGLVGVSFGSCAKKYGAVEYGVPYATLDVSGAITDEEAKPVANIRVTVRNEDHQILPEVYSEEDGLYSTQANGAFPIPHIEIIAEDTSGVYAPDTARVDVQYDRTGVSGSDHWNEGSASVQQDFKLKKK